MNHHARLYIAACTLIIIIAGLWPFNFSEKNNAHVGPDGGLLLARHGTAYTAASPEKIRDLTRFAIHVDLQTSSDGLGSLEKILGYFISQADENFFLGQWKDGMELQVRTERNRGGMIFGADGVLKNEERTRCLITYDGTKLSLYQDGKLKRYRETGLLNFSNWDRTYPLVVGADGNGRSQWKGRLYEIALFDRALTSDEVMSLSSLSSLSGREGKEADSRQPTANSRKNQAARQCRGAAGFGLRDSRFGREKKGEIAAQPSAARNDMGEKSILRQAQDDRQTYPTTGSGWQGRQAQDDRPLIHYVFKQENTYPTEFGGRKAFGVRDLGKGTAADLVVPEYFAPYQRVYLGWDADWMKRSSDWMDVAVNIIGFLPFGLLLFLEFGKRLVEGDRCQVTGDRCQVAGDRAAERHSSEDSGRPSGSEGSDTGEIAAGLTPLAMTGCFAAWTNTAASRSIVLAVLVAVVVGFGVSFAIEWLQAYLPSRDSSLRDLMTNVIGTAIGAIAAAVLARRYQVAGDR